ncbi:MAG: hypothetical protein HQL53_07270 [Magnetococcales bacterium]|nr:hypothetical protein [Magnetococcales bacterium]
MSSQDSSSSAPHSDHDGPSNANQHEHTISSQRRLQVLTIILLVTVGIVVTVKLTLTRSASPPPLRIDAPPPKKFVPPLSTQDIASIKSQHTISAYSPNAASSPFRNSRTPIPPPAPLPPEETARELGMSDGNLQSSTLTGESVEMSATLQERAGSLEENNMVEEASLLPTIGDISTLTGAWVTPLGRMDLTLGELLVMGRIEPTGIRLEGIAQGGQLYGFWSRTFGKRACLERRDTKRYWGRFRFLPTPSGALLGHWSHCEKEPDTLTWRGHRP